jgi:hypothetical protein
VTHFVERKGHRTYRPELSVTHNYDFLVKTKLLRATMAGTSTGDNKNEHKITVGIFEGCVYIF